MKKIEKITIPGATALSPLEMNKIHFETGQHSEVPAGKEKVTLA